MLANFGIGTPAMTVVLQQGINGVVLGSLYVLVALGLTLVYGVLVQINFAHADVVTLGAFSAYFFMHGLGGGYLPSIAVALVIGAAIGWLMNVAVFAPLRHRGNELLPLIATIGVSVMLENAMLAWFGPIPYAFESPYSNNVIRFGHVFITQQNVLIVATSIATIALLYAFMKFTFLGKALRAVSQDRETAGLMGINPDRIVMLTFVIACALAGMAGALLGPVLVLTPFAGTSVIVKAFAIVIIGGFGNVEGTILAVGLIESFTTQYLDTGMIDIVVFGLLLLTLALRPTGLIAERREENV
jgi:branched-chain amino acid transport system permease protein